MDVLIGMDGVLVLATAIGVIAAAIVELIKLSYRATAKGKDINPNIIPLVSIIIGLIVGALVYPFTPMDLSLRLWAGGISGLMASGLYETVKRTTKI